MIVDTLHIKNNRLLIIPINVRLFLFKTLEKKIFLFHIDKKSFTGHKTRCKYCIIFIFIL
jgi:hypothetical protein